MGFLLQNSKEQDRATKFDVKDVKSESKKGFFDLLWNFQIGILIKSSTKEMVNK